MVPYDRGSLPEFGKNICLKWVPVSFLLTPPLCLFIKHRRYSRKWKDDQVRSESGEIPICSTCCLEFRPTDDWTFGRTTSTTQLLYEWDVLSESHACNRLSLQSAMKKTRTRPNQVVNKTGQQTSFFESKMFNWWCFDCLLKAVRIAAQTEETGLICADNFIIFFTGQCN